MSTQPLIYLRRPPDWEEHEKPSLPGSPGMIAHPSWMRVCYALVAVLVGITGGLGNALFVANLPTIQGQMGLTNLEASWLTGAYVTFNVTANMLVYKFRQQFGMRLFTEIGLGLYATLCVLHLFLGSTASLMWLRGASGLVAAACISLGTLYMLQALPRKYVFKTLMLGLGISQLAAPLAWVLSPGLLEHGQWDNLYVFEAGLALLSFAAVIVLKLPSGVHIKVFEWRDFISMSLLIPGVGLLVAFLVQGSILWWTDAPELAWLLSGAIVLLSAGLYLEHHRPSPMFHTRWFTQSATLRFVIGAVILRFLTTEQSYGVVGMMRTLGMAPEQMQSLFLVILAGTLVGLIVAALTAGLDNVGKQLILAIVLLGAGAYLDFGRTSLDRPQDFFLSQFLIAMGSGIFIGPLMLLGIAQGIKNGSHYMLTAILTISITQSLGGLMGSTLLGTYQTYREHTHSAALVEQIDPARPEVAQRLRLLEQQLAVTVSDPAQRTLLAQAQLDGIVRREANVLAYNDVFWVVALVASAYLLWSLLQLGQTRLAAAKAARRAIETPNAVGTDGAAEDDEDVKTHTVKPD